MLIIHIIILRTQIDFGPLWAAGHGRADQEGLMQYYQTVSEQVNVRQPSVPRWCYRPWRESMSKCLAFEASRRPSFSELVKSGKCTLIFSLLLIYMWRSPFAHVRIISHALFAFLSLFDFLWYSYILWLISKYIILL